MHVMCFLPIPSFYLNIIPQTPQISPHCALSKINNTGLMNTPCYETNITIASSVVTSWVTHISTGSMITQYEMVLYEKDICLGGVKAMHVH